MILALELSFLDEFEELVVLLLKPFDFVFHPENTFFSPDGHRLDVSLEIILVRLNLFQFFGKVDDLLLFRGDLSTTGLIFPIAIFEIFRCLFGDFVQTVQLIEQFVPDHRALSMLNATDEICDPISHSIVIC